MKVLSLILDRESRMQMAGGKALNGWDDRGKTTCPQSEGWLTIDMRCALEVFARPLLNTKDDRAAFKSVRID